MARLFRTLPEKWQPSFAELSEQVRRFFSLALLFCSISNLINLLECH
jgi:hypothetical protein